MDLRRQTRKHAVALVLSALVPFAAFAWATEATQPPLEYQVKAAFLLNFTRFIEWPAADAPPGAPFSICVLGDDPFNGALDRMVEGEAVNGRKLAVQRIHRQQQVSCQIVFAA